ncbi:MAG: PD-(D/E)XK nuclease family protein [Nanoarchaeota archaeon]|nr:PD-(D/E)XK nuclease family protein [Nanoarchaeota archaeon]
MNIPYIRTGESEIDFLIVEEFFSNTQFQKWILKKLCLNCNFEFICAWKSYLGRFCECDVATKFKLENKTYMLLFENKIYSSEQPNQALRYHETGKYLLENKKIDKYLTCLICPEKYFKEDAPMNLYEYKITYEELIEFFNSQKLTNRTLFKKMVIQNGIDRARTGYQRITDNKTNSFYEFYEKLARELYPQFEYKKPKEVASGNLWIRFNPKTLPAKITIVHKAEEGYIDLQFSNVTYFKFKSEYFEKFNKNMSLHQTGKSISLRIITSKIPKIAEIINIRDYELEIREALENVNILLQWYEDNFN